MSLQWGGGVLLSLLLVEDRIKDLLLLCWLHGEGLSSTTLELGKDLVDHVLNRVIEHDGQCWHDHKSESSGSPLLQSAVGTVLEEFCRLVDNSVNSDSRLRTNMK